MNEAYGTIKYEYKVQVYRFNEAEVEMWPDFSILLLDEMFWKHFQRKFAHITLLAPFLASEMQNHFMTFPFF